MLVAAAGGWLDQGWAIISADGPHVGRPSPSRAELLDEQKRAQ